MTATSTSSSTSPIPIPTAAQVIAWTFGMAALSILAKVLVGAAGAG